jgi:serine/threonine protein kinase
LISKILVKNPADRLTIDEILDHPFFQSRQIPPLMDAATLTADPPEKFVLRYKNSMPFLPKKAR